MRTLVFALSFILVGCGGTPKQDDHVKHVNNLENKVIKGVRFHLADGLEIDLRGRHSNDTSTSTANLMYAGDAGLIGVFAQVGMHASIVDSQRQDLLHEKQLNANKQISEYISAIQGLETKSLVQGHKSLLMEGEDTPAEKVFQIKPIYYASQDKSTLMLKLVVWQDKSSLITKTEKKKKSKKKRNKSPYSYLNMVQVFSQKLNQEQIKQIVNGDNSILVAQLSDLLSQAMTIAANGLEGRYASNKMKTQTFFLTENKKRRVIRGSLVEKNCQLKVIKNLHAWYVALPVNADESRTKNNINCVNQRSHKLVAPI